MEINASYFTKEELACTPSRKCAIDANEELSYRQQAANFIQDMGQRLQVSQLCINTAIVYMHRFYVFHSFSKIHRNNLSVAALFLAAKVEEQPRKLEHVIKVAHMCLHKDAPPLDVRSKGYAEKQFEVVDNESILLQTLGFMLAIEHPHTYVVKVCQLVKACKDLAETSYFMATRSLHMTTMCLQYKPTLVACVCIHLACKWSSWKIEPCSEGKEWYYYVDKTVTLELLENLTQEFIAILETSPHTFKGKFIPQKQETIGHTQKSSSDDVSKHHSLDKPVPVKKENPLPGPSTSFNLSHVAEKPVSIKVENSDKHPVPPQPVHSPQPPKKNKVSSHSISLDAYRDKREKERLDQKSVPPAVEPTHNVQQAVSRPQHALNGHKWNGHKHVSKCLDSHSNFMKEKANKSKEPHHHQVHSSSSSKMNHHFSKKLESSHSKESKSNLLKLPPNLASNPVLALDRIDVKSERQGALRSEIVPSVSQASSTTKLLNTQDFKFPVPTENLNSFVPNVPVTTSSVTIKTKYHKHKTNSLRSNSNSVHLHAYKNSPIKDVKTNGSKETDSIERRNANVENNARVKTEISSKREKFKTKHSYNSSKDKVVNNSEPSNSAIIVKIRKEDINKLPEKSQKFQPSVKVEFPKKPLKITISKPPVPEPVKTTTPLKLVITKDKSGSGSYCTSQKNERESKKRAHSPSSHEVNFKSSGEMPSKYAKLDHDHSSHSNTKQSKSRHNSSHTSNNVSSNKLLNQANVSAIYSI